MSSYIQLLQANGGYSAVEPVVAASLAAYFSCLLMFVAVLQTSAVGPLFLHGESGLCNAYTCRTPPLRNFFAQSIMAAIFHLIGISDGLSLIPTFPIC